MPTPSPEPAPAWRRVCAGAVGGALAAVGLCGLAGVSASSGVVDVLCVGGAVVGAASGRRHGHRLALAGACLLLGRLVILRPVFLLVVGGAAAAAGLAWRLSPRRAALGRGHLLGSSVVVAVAAVVYAAYSLERHLRFGSGSWDYGCYLHNAWLFAHGDAFSPTAVSSVLGDARFWGGTNHFMPSLVFTAPLAWLMEATESTSWLLVAQVLVVCAAALPLALLARRAGLGPLTTTAVAGAFLFHTATQSFLLFDVHEIAPVPLLLFVVLWIMETYPPTRRSVLVVFALLLVLGGCKESALLYAAAVGAFALVFHPAWRVVGAAVVVSHAVLFFLVVSVVQPALLEDGARMLHVARFSAFSDGGGMGAALVGVLLHPGRALLLLVQPERKLLTLGAAVAGFGGLPLASGETLALVLPNLAERFLSDKREMWGQGFHYGLVGAACLAFGTVQVAGRLLRRVAARRPDQAGAADVAAAVFFVSATIAASAASPTPPELASFTKPYYATDADIDRYRRALAFVDDDDAVVAQNHFLPHVALRRHVWLPERRFIERADVVILDDEASPWPHDRRHVRALITALERDPRFVSVFHESTTRVFRRRPR